jgi:hypothetical protein
MGWKIYDEAVEMVEQRHRYFPHTFRWRGRLFEVDTVERCWTVVRSGWRRRAERQFFRLRCGDGSFELFQDLRDGTWHLRRAKFGSVQVPAVRGLAPAWQ